MNRILKLLFVFTLIHLAMILPSRADSSSMTKGGRMPSITLSIPKNPAERSYLGFSGPGHFKLSQINAQAVIIKVFNTYCPVCQATAAAMNELYHRIESDQDIKNKIKLIGIGAGNTLHEIEVFKETHKIPFPIFPDKDFNIYRALGETKTPYIIAVKTNRDGSQDAVHTQPGGFTEAGPFLELILDVYGFKRKDPPYRGEEYALPITN